MKFLLVSLAVFASAVASPWDSYDSYELSPQGSVNKDISKCTFTAVKDLLDCELKDANNWKDLIQTQKLIECVVSAGTDIMKCVKLPHAYQELMTGVQKYPHIFEDMTHLLVKTISGDQQ